MPKYFCVEGWDENGKYIGEECYPREFKAIILEFLDSVKIYVEGKDEIGDYWTRYTVDKRKWWKAFEGMMWKYSGIDVEIVAMLGHFAWIFRDAKIIDIG